MNETIKSFIPYILAFFAGAVIFGGLSGFWIYNSANKRIADAQEQNTTLRRTNQEVRDTNLRLADTIKRDAELKQQLSNTIEQQQRDLNRARADLAGAIDANKSAGQYLAEAIKYLDWIIERYSNVGSQQEVLEND